MVRDRFQFLKSFADTIKNVSQADEMLAKDLAMRIINYGIYGIDEKSENPLLEAMFVQIKIMIDKGTDISEKRRKANKQRTNIEQNLTNDEQNKPKKKIENNKIENIKNNILSKDSTETKVSAYGNEEINQCLELISHYNGGLIDGTKQNQRRYSKLLIDKLNKLESIKEGKFTWYDTLEIILKVIANNKYYASKITSPENIYRNLSVLMQQCKADIGKANTSQTVLPVL